MANPTEIRGARQPVAATPQNTPANASIGALSRPQVPPAVAEQDEEVEGTIQSDRQAALAGNPVFTQMVQGRLQSLVNRSSGYVESLPLAVRQRVDALKGLQSDQSAIEAEFQREIFELEKRFAERYRPIFDQRARIIAGEEEPEVALIDKGRSADRESDDEDDEDEDAPPVDTEHATAQQISQAPKGIPEFWLSALKNNLGLSEIITERDEAALKHLTDVRTSYLEKPGFKLIFSFGPGAKDFFENDKLEKTYFYQDRIGYEGDFIYGHAEGTEIMWREGKNLTVKTETKKQRNKNTGQTRVVKKQVPTDSFFTFFSPPKQPADDDDDAEVPEDLDEQLELDYQIGEDIKERVIPRAVDYFTGKALRFEQGDLDSDEFDEDAFDEDDDEDDDDEVVPAGRRGPRRVQAPPALGVTPASAQDPQECKQS